MWLYFYAVGRKDIYDHDIQSFFLEGRKYVRVVGRETGCFNYQERERHITVNELGKKVNGFPFPSLNM